MLEDDVAGAVVTVATGAVVTEAAAEHSTASASTADVMLLAGFAATSSSSPANSAQNKKRPIETALNTTEDAQGDANLNAKQETESGGEEDEEEDVSTKRNKSTASLLLGTGASFAHPRIGDEYQTALPEFLGKRPTPVSSSPSTNPSKPEQAEPRDVVEKET